MMLDAQTRTILLMAACQSIAQRLNGAKYRFKSNDPNPMLRKRRASFVTLKRHGVLRGCIGTLEPKHPLLVDVIHNAKAAAFADPRFPALTAPELESLHVEISVLSSAEPINAHCRAELLDAVHPGKDGLIVQEDRRCATFLPAVWTSLPDPDSFYDELMKKAGLGTDYWSPELKFFRYHTESFEQDF